MKEGHASRLHYLQLPGISVVKLHGSYSDCAGADNDRLVSAAEAKAAMKFFIGFINKVFNYSNKLLAENLYENGIK